MIDPRYDLTVGNVERWRNAQQVKVWKTMREQARPTVRRPRVDWYMRFYQLARAGFQIAVGAAIFTGMYVIYEVGRAFLSGRVEEILRIARLSH